MQKPPQKEKELSTIVQSSGQFTHVIELVKWKEKMSFIHAPCKLTSAVHLSARKCTLSALGVTIRTWEKAEAGA